MSLKMSRGKFIVVEGLDGSGSTTQAINLASYLFNSNKANAPVLTREPTSLNPYGQEIRRRLENRLLSYEKQIDSFQYWADLFVNDRKWHLDNVVIPNCNIGLPVISDRHMLSTLAYQSAQGGEMEKLIEMHQRFITPDLTLFLSVPVDVALERIKHDRKSPPEYFEKKRNFMERTFRNYNKAIDLVGDVQNIIVIDGTLPIKNIEKLIQKEVKHLYI
ncbi:MAG: dTMP kinase [Nanoarchaeota archaeon]|nr:dTMP kinase [Nanoarchaeota archaeon]MBU1632028.1 dTMP kinase [Nanoarchaeota archaeon]MBU1875964.1 dTMP kinase [Nanoarchaeota archaeon]